MFSAISLPTPFPREMLPLEQYNRDQTFTYYQQQQQHLLAQQQDSQYSNTPPASAISNDFHLTDYHNQQPQYQPTMVSPPETRHNSGDYIDEPQLVHQLAAQQQQVSHFQKNFGHFQPPVPHMQQQQHQQHQHQHIDQHSQSNVFTEEDLKILKECLPVAETFKWKYIANKVSKSRTKKMTSEFCSARFHDFFNLPHNKSSDANVHYISNNNSFYDSEAHDNVEGILGSSLPYLVHNPSP